MLTFLVATGQYRISRSTHRLARNFDNANRGIGGQAHGFHGNGANRVGHRQHCAALQKSRHAREGD